MYALEHGCYYGLGMDALLTVCSRTWMLLWFGHGCSGNGMLLYMGVVVVCSGKRMLSNMDVIMVWAWMLW